MKDSTMVSALIILQVLGIVFGAGLAVYDIESIVVSGPVFSLTGTAIAGISFWTQRPIGFYFGAATPTVAVACFSLICGLEWSPGRAQVPISILLVAFAQASIPAGALSFVEARKDQPLPPRRPFQFGIAALLRTTLITALLLSLVQITSFQWMIRFNQQWIAILALALYAAVAQHVVRRFHRRRLSMASELGEGKEDTQVRANCQAAPRHPPSE